MWEIFTGLKVSEKPLQLQVPLSALSGNLKPGDIVTIKGTGWQRDIGLPFRIPEDQKWEIVCPDLIPVCPDLIPEGAD